ncbi:MAG TPA: PHB depolymerase family esterase [Acidimicrobiales bacterium]|nr:PHB depolymerase family esterase [Acidimicrobiales bacterium]
MTRRRRFARAARLAAVAAALAAAAVLLVAPSSAASGAGADPVLEKRTQPPLGAVGPRDYYIARPATPVEPRRLVVFLHGCNQTAPDVAVGTRIAAAATARGWFVVLPEQRPYQGADFSDGNGSRCWNWFLPQHQARTGGEPATLAAITRNLVTELSIDPRRVYAAGISAGADMTTVLGVTHPDLFAAVAPYSGCAYLTCGDVTGVAAHRAMGEHARLVPAFVSQGSADMVNNAAMGDTALRQWLAVNDLADDGRANGSVPPTPTATATFEAQPSAAPGAGDPCIGNSRLPCAGGAAGASGSYPYTVSKYETADGAAAVEHWLIHGLNHAYPGGDTRGTFVDPLGPDLTNAILDFFDRNPMPVRPASTAEVPTGQPPASPSGSSGRPSGGSSSATTTTVGREHPATGASPPVAAAAAGLGAALVLRRRR